MTETLIGCNRAFIYWMNENYNPKDKATLKEHYPEDYESMATGFAAGWKAAQSSEISVIETGEPDYKAMSSFELTAALGMDGRKWAQAFCQHVGFNDRGWAITWFCNAVMAGYDEACRRVAALDNKPPLIMREIGEGLRERLITAYRNIPNDAEHTASKRIDAIMEVING